MAARKPIIGGNWKMNLDLASCSSLAGDIARGAEKTADKVETVLFVPFVYIQAVGDILKQANSRVRLGAQDFYHQANGAYTGEISLSMLDDLDVTDVLVGHSERRHILGEKDGLLNAKLRAGLDAGFNVTLCVGETLEQRDAGQTNEVNSRQLTNGLNGVPGEQLDRLIVAYEPVWAIGTGKTATPEDAQSAHLYIRNHLAELYNPDLAGKIRIQYGGSVKPGNASALFSQPDIDGGLIGGASLKADEFLAIIAAAAG